MASQVSIDTTVTITDCGVWLFERDVTVTIEYSTDAGDVYDWYPVEFTVTDDRIDKRGKIIRGADGKAVQATVHIEPEHPLFALLVKGLDDDKISERVNEHNAEAGLFARAWRYATDEQRDHF